MATNCDANCARRSPGLLLIIARPLWCRLARGARGQWAGGLGWRRPRQGERATERASERASEQSSALAVTAAG